MALAQVQRRPKAMIWARYRAKGHLAGCVFKTFRFTGEAGTNCGFLCALASLRDAMILTLTFMRKTVSKSISGFDLIR
ncbi:MAG: hypothetical protein GY697_18660 [Desulfobacterales bacterium]|nr:hypothetical protein [Desulfobacterales bacterium]